MTDQEPARLADRLEAVCAAVAQLRAGGPAAQRISVRAGDITVELDWTAGAAAPVTGAPPGSSPAASAGAARGGPAELVPANGQADLAPAVIARAVNGHQPAASAQAANPAAQAADPAAQAAAPAASAPAAPGDASASPASGQVSICAEAVGTFYRSPEPGAAPFVTEGDVVQPGQQVALLEAMKMMIPVAAAQAGRVTEILVENSTAVEFGTPLMTLAPVSG